MRTVIALAAGTLVALVLAGTGGAAGSPSKLLTKFQPVLVLHPGEEFRPTAVESFVRDSNLEAAVSQTDWVIVDASPTADGLPTASPPVWRLNQRDCFAGDPLGDLACYAAGATDEPGATVYGRVVRDGKSIVLQYWLFYYDNLYRYPFPLPVGEIWQSHEGDWEVVNVVLSRSKRPLSVGLSQHCSGESRSWAETERRHGHPAVYVALGSHANYFEPGLHPFDPACLPSQVIAFFLQAGLSLPADVAAPGPTVGPKRLSTTKGALARVKDGSPSWIAFPGFWGELEYFSAPAPIGTVPFGTSPMGPAFHAVWREPLATLATWR